jgi:hypothetical protein
MGKKYLDTKGGSLEQSILGVWNQAAAVTETNKNDKSDDGEGLDSVQPKAVKKKFKDRKDKDIDNDGDTDSSDEYLHKRRKAVGKAMATEAFSPKEIKMAIGVASDPRYAGGNYSGAVRAIEKIAKGLSNHKQVAGVLKSKNEGVDLTANAEEYTKQSYFTVQSMRERLHQVWGESNDPEKDDEKMPDEKKIKGKKAKTDTGKDAAVIDVKPEINKERDPR